MIIHTQHGLRYLTKLPKQGISQVRFMGELLRLKEGKRSWKTGNIEPRSGLPLLIYSPFHERYWYRTLKTDHDMSRYQQYLKDGNLYILWDDDQRRLMNEERDKEGMKYYHYNEIRELIILSERLSKQADKSELKTKQKVIEKRIQHIKNLYQ